MAQRAYTPQWLLDLKVGDKVIKEYYSNRTIETVTAATQTTVTVTGWKYRRGDGGRLGEGKYTSMRIREYSPEREQALIEENRRKDALLIVSKLDLRSEREKLTTDQLERIAAIMKEGQ